MRWNCRKGFSKKEKYQRVLRILKSKTQNLKMRANQQVLVEILNHPKIQKTLKEIPGKIQRKRQRVKRLNHTRKSPNQILTRIK